MFDIDHVQDDDISRPLYPPHSSNVDGGGLLDSKQALMAHLLGLGSGALIILGTTAAVCAAVRLL